MTKIEGLKKGTEYSHYCGTELLEIVCSIRLCMDLANEDESESKKWGERAIFMTERLRDKIGQLDKLNGMEY